MSKKKISLVVEPADYFREVIEDAAEEQRLKLAQATQAYIVNLLTHYMVADNLFTPPTNLKVAESPVEIKSAEKKENTNPGVVEEKGSARVEVTLAELLLYALNAPTPTERIKLLRRLGDTSLYISGFFGDSLSRKLVDVDYYKDMGETAYGHLSSTVREDDFQKIFKELSEKFSGLVDVLTRISQLTQVQDDKNILRLYERYIRTGSELAKKQLAEMGIPVTLDTKIEKGFKN